MIGDLASVRAVGSLLAVLALLGGAVWLLRRGATRLSGWKTRTSIVVETAMSLGERRSLAIVNVEGRRVLIGLTPGAVSLIADLAPAPSSPGDSSSLT
jgi:flagellar protein FliO/FliZ